MNYFFQRHRSNRGFTLMMAVLMGSVLLAIGSAIFNILSKQVIFSNAGRESQFAFYAADSGIECVLFWDYKRKAFKSTSTEDIVCNGQTVTPVRSFDAGSGVYTTTFEFSLGATENDPCVAVSVFRTFSPTRTTVESAGHNTCVLASPRYTERTIRVRY